VRDLGLAPHPEGGWYREIHRSPGRLELERGVRSALTVIDYAIERGSFSAFHRVASEEVWSWCGGDPLELSLLGAPPNAPDGATPDRATPDGGQAADAFRSIALGPDRAGGQLRMAVVPAGVWQAAEPFALAEGQGYAWCSCFVAPGFDFADFELAERAALAAAFPDHAARVARLTRR
jgi:predicted cupin superfamily sugar epimerase